MQRLRQILLQENTLVFMFCLAVITGPAISVLFAYDLTQFHDALTYLGLSHFDFDQSPVRRYRVIIPFTAALLNYLFGGVFSKLAPTYFVGDFSIPFSFFVVNTLLSAYLGLLTYRYCRAFNVNRPAALVGTLALLTSRYTAYNAALPMVDSLFSVVVAMTLLGIKQKNTGMLICAIFLGPFAKESFIFIAPLIFFFSHIGKLKQIAYFALSALLVFGFRYIYDAYAPPHRIGGLAADIAHMHNIIRYLSSLFSFYGIYKVLMNFGLWMLAPLVLLLVSPGAGKAVLGKMDGYLGWFFFSVLIQMLLSGSFERMFYLAMPVISVIVALSVKELGKLYAPAEK